jgi:predicted TIM-barrel fold metal-dependent hydrolase
LKNSKRRVEVMRKINAYSHFVPKAFVDAFSKKVIPVNQLDQVDAVRIPTIYDVDKRLKIMDSYPDLLHVLTPTGPALETYCKPDLAVDLARLFNDAMAEVVEKHRDRFAAAVACLPLNNIDGTLEEIDRTITQLGFKGILLNTPIFEHGYNYETMKPLDRPEYWPMYEKMAKYDLPIWIHPRGYGGVPVYSGEERGRYGLDHCFGWPMETVMAMGRLVGAGVLAKYPTLKIITHHCGGGIVPILVGRIQGDIPVLKMREGKSPDESILGRKPPVDYYKMFYADTALYGDSVGLMCGLTFFGVERMVYGDDFPYDYEGGDKYTRQTIEAVYRMDISDAARQMIFEGNISRLLRLK